MQRRYKMLVIFLIKDIEIKMEALRNHTFME